MGCFKNGLRIVVFLRIQKCLHCLVHRPFLLILFPLCVGVCVEQGTIGRVWLYIDGRLVLLTSFRCCSFCNSCMLRNSKITFFR